MNRLPYHITTAILISLVLLSSLTGFSQNNYERTLSYSELLREIRISESDSQSYNLTNALIKFDYDRGDSLYCTAVEDFFTGRVVYVATHIENLNFTIPITFNHCQFKSLSSFRTSTFKYLDFYDCLFDKISFDSCMFSEGIGFHNCVVEDLMIIENSEVNYINGGVSISKSKVNRLTLKNIKINFTDLSRLVRMPYYNACFRINKSQIVECNIIDISVPESMDDTLPTTLGINQSSIEELTIKNCEVKGMDFNKLNIEGSLLFDNVNIQKYFSAMFFEFPSENSNISWSYFAGNKIGLIDQSGKNVYQANEAEDFQNEILFSELISAYNKFYRMYKTRGDIESANACYVEMKDIASRRQKYLYEEDHSLDTWFNWKLSQFLKVFCAYGTSPVKSLIISMWVILGFALFYFFTYSEWDKINRNFLIKRYRKMLSYFDSEQRLEDFYSEEHKDEFQSYEEFKVHMAESYKRVPTLFGLLGKPLYHLSLSHHRLIKWLYRLIEPLSGRWVDLKGGRKIYVGSMVIIGVTGYSLYLLLLRTVNSLFLSMNTFTTLGFGEIPVKGIGRYLAILEGFLGWFLLSIFSVSLISQILQN